MSKHISVLVKNGFIAGTISAAIAFLLNYYLLPFPATLMDNAIGHGIGSFMSGFISAAVGITVYIHHQRVNEAAPQS
jgi:hypothetical protein